MALARWVSFCALAVCLGRAPAAMAQVTSPNSQSAAHSSASPPRRTTPVRCQKADPFARPRVRQPIALAHRPPERLPPGDEVIHVEQGQQLSLEGLIEAVQARNPSIQAMAAAWRAAAQRYPQVVSLNDPMFGFMVGPASFGSSDVDDAYMVEARQQIPWHGKREARGQAALSEARAASLDIGDARLRVREATQLAFFDYYLASRQLELNRLNRTAVERFRDIARSKYEANQATQQDFLQADVEVADIERRQLELDRMYRVAAARINTLLRVTPDSPLPPAPSKLARPLDPPPADLLRQWALQQRPDLAAIDARIRAEQAAVTLACRDYYPDVEVVGRYDAFWQPPEQDLRPQIGMNMNVPLYKEKRRAAVQEAMFRVAQRRAEFEQRALDIQFEVHSAFEQLGESQRAVELYERRLLPAAEQNVEAARANYDVGNTSFLGLIQAQRQLISIRERQQETLTEYHRRVAALERTIGGPLPIVPRQTPTPIWVPSPR